MLLFFKLTVMPSDQNSHSLHIAQTAHAPTRAKNSPPTSAKVARFAASSPDPVSGPN